MAPCRRHVLCYMEGREEVTYCIVGHVQCHVFGHNIHVLGISIYFSVIEPQESMRNMQLLLALSTSRIGETTQKRNDFPDLTPSLAARSSNRAA